MKTYISVLVTASILLFSSTTYADNCEQGAYFYKKGQLRSARTVLSPLLKKGEACAEYYIGRSYKEDMRLKPHDKYREKGLKLIKSAEKKGYPAAVKFMSEYH